MMVSRSTVTMPCQECWIRCAIAAVYNPSPIRRSYRGNAVSSFLQRDGFSAAMLSEHGGAIAVLELEGPYFFGSAGKIEREVDRLAEAGTGHIILDFKRVSSIDSTASRSLARICGRLKMQGKTLFLSYLVPQSQRQTQNIGGEMWRQPSALLAAGVTTATHRSCTVATRGASQLS